MAREIPVKTDIKVKQATPDLQFSEPTGNPLAKYFWALAVHISDLPANADKKQIANSLGFSIEDLNHVLKALDEVFGLAPEDETIYEFFTRVSAVFHGEFVVLGNKITHGVVPANIQELLRNMEQAKTELTETGKELKLEKYGIIKSESCPVSASLLEETAEQIKNDLESQGVTTSLSDEQIIVLAAAALKQDQNLFQQEAETTTTDPKAIKVVYQNAAQQIPPEYRITRTAIAHRLTHPTPEMPQQIPQSLVRKITPHSAREIATAMMLTTHSPENRVMITSPLIALALKTELQENEGDYLTNHFVSSATPILKAAARKLRPAIIHQAAKQEVEQIVVDHFISLGIGEIENESVTPVVEIATRTFTTLPNSFASAVSRTASPHSRSPNEQMASLPGRKPTQVLNLFAPNPKDPAMGLWLSSVIAQQPQLSQSVTHWSTFHQWVNTQSLGLAVYQDPFMAHLDRIYYEDGIAQQIFETPLYQAQTVLRPIINIGQRTAQNKLVQLVTTKGPVGKVVNKAKGKFFEFAAQRVVKRLAEKGVLMTVEKAAELFAKEGISVTLAALLGLPTGGSSLIIWAAIEVVKKAFSLIKKTIKRLKIDKAFEKITAGLFTDIRNWLRNNFGKLLGDAFFWGLVVPGSFLIGLPTLLLTVSIGPMLVFVFIITFAVIAFMNSQNMQRINSLAPPTGRGGGTEEIAEGDLEGMLPFDIERSYCQTIGDNSARLACEIPFVLQEDCAIPAIVTSASFNNVKDCLENSEIIRELSPSVSEIINAFNISLQIDGTLQCVGFKKAVEPGLPGGIGDAKDYYNNHPGCSHIYYPGENMSAIEAGQNAVWATGTWGHIAIIIGVDYDSGMIHVAQAWGGSGRINFKSIPAAAVSEIFDCSP